MGHRLSEYSQSELIYDLSAVLIHKGSAVNSGHYIAHIKDENTGQWWEFDDEHVSNLGRHPFAEGSSNSATKSVQIVPVVHSSSSEPIDAVANGNHVDANMKYSESNVVNSVQRFSSSDAYMLMYVLRKSKNGGEKVQIESGGFKMENGGGLTSQYSVSLPSHLFEEIEQLNTLYLDACKQYQSKKERELNRIAERRQEVRSVLSQAPVHSHVEPYFWISTEWLRHWSDNISPS